MKKISIYIFAFILLGFAACDVINPDEPIPAYIHIKDFNVSTSIAQGSSSAKITDGYLYINDEFLGVYELPKTIPVIATGTTDIKVDPGIKENGIAATPDIYPFYKRFSASLNLEAGEIDTLTPVTSYVGSGNFAYLEDFDIGNTLTFDADGDTLNPVTVFTSGAFEGRSAKFSVTENAPYAEVATHQKFVLPTKGDIAFLEIHYKNDAPLQVGLIGYQQNSETPIKFLKITLNPREDWNKIYINITPDLTASDLFQYQLLFAGSLPNGASEASFYLDNIKLIHF